MTKNRLENFITMDYINSFLIEKSFKEFIISKLTDDQLEEYGKKYGDWFNRQYEKMKNERKDIQNDLVIKNLILLKHLQFPIYIGEWE